MLFWDKINHHYLFNKLSRTLSGLIHSLFQWDVSFKFMASKFRSSRLRAAPFRFSPIQYISFWKRRNSIVVGVADDKFADNNNSRSRTDYFCTERRESRLNSDGRFTNGAKRLPCAELNFEFTKLHAENVGVPMISCSHQRYSKQKRIVETRKETMKNIEFSVEEGSRAVVNNRANMLHTIDTLRPKCTAILC